MNGLERFRCMYNIASHVSKNYNKIFIDNIREFTFNDISFRKDFATYSAMKLYNTELNANICIMRLNVEIEAVKRVTIHYNTYGNMYKLLICNNIDDDTFYIKGTEIDRIDFPLSPDVLFNLNLMPLPFALDLKLLNSLKNNLESSSFHYRFYLGDI